MRTQGVRGRQQRTVTGADMTFTHDRERDVRQRRQVTGAAEAAVFVDHRRQPGGQQRGVCLGDVRSDPGATGGQRPEAGGDAVRRDGIVRQRFDACPTRGDRGHRIVGEHRSRITTRHPHDVVGTDGADTHHNLNHPMIVHAPPTGRPI